MTADPLAALLHGRRDDNDEHGDPASDRHALTDCDNAQEWLDEAARLRAAGVDTRAAVLDVERLARVFAAHFGPSYFPNMTDVTIHGSSPEEIAEQVAREYRESGS